MENLSKEANGDPEKMQQMLLEAQKNPEAFYKKMSPEQRAQIQGLVKKIESKGTSVPKNK